MGEAHHTYCVSDIFFHIKAVRTVRFWKEPGNLYSKTVQIQSLPGLETDVDFRILLGPLVPTVGIHQVGDDFQRPRAANQELHVADELSGCLVMLRPARVDSRPVLRFRSLSGSAVRPSCGVGK